MQDFDIVIEKASIADLEEILSLQKLAFKAVSEIYKYCKIPPTTQTLESLKEEFKRKLFLKAVHDGKIVGSIRGLNGRDACYPERLMVHPDYRNQGIGTKLLDSIEEYFSDAKRYEIIVMSKSEENIRLYEKLGYKIFKTKRIAGDLDFVYMEKYR